MERRKSAGKGRGAARYIRAKALAILRAAMYTALMAGTCAVIILALIANDTPEKRQAAEEKTSATPLPSPAPLPGNMRAVDSDDIDEIRRMFPAPLATLSSKNGFSLITGRVEDARPPGVRQTCRIVTLTYANLGLSGQVILRSATPGAFALYYAREAFTLAPDTIALGPLAAMELVIGDARCYVAASDDAVYAVEGHVTMEDLARAPGYVYID